MPVSLWLGLTHRAGLDQLIDRVAIEPGFGQDRNAILSDIRSRAKSVFGKAGNARRTRRVDRTNPGRIVANRRLCRLDMGVAQPFAGIENSFRNEIGCVQLRKPNVRRLRQEHLAQL
jgi:hypothetical protein